MSTDVEMLDDRLAQWWNQFLTYVLIPRYDRAPLTAVRSNALSVAGVFALITYTYPYLALTFIPLLMMFVSGMRDVDRINVSLFSLVIILLSSFTG